MADDAGRLNQVLAETSFLYGANAGFVEDLHARWASDPATVEPSWRAFFTSLSDGADAVRKSAEAPSWTPPPTELGRPDWVSAIDGLWPAVAAKLGREIAVAAPTAGPDEVRARTLDSLRAVSYTHLRAHETGRNLVCRL